MKMKLCRTGRYALVGGLALGVLFAIMILAICWMME